MDGATTGRRVETAAAAALPAPVPALRTCSAFCARTPASAEDVRLMVDLSIARLLEYGLMPRPRSLLMVALCVGTLAVAGCGSKAPVRAVAPQPAPPSAPARVQAA